MKKTWITLSVILAINFSANCQLQKTFDSRIIFNGVVRDASTLGPLAGSQISINGSFFAVSAGDGTFSIQVNKKDTIIISHLGYQPANLIVSDTLSGAEFMAGVYLRTDTVTIGEVVVIPRIQDLKYDLFKAPPTSQEMENAKYNMAVSAYQGRISIGKLGDSRSNYAVIHQKHLVDASEKGTIPSDRMVGLSPFLLIPAAYLLIHGLPEKEAPLGSNLTQQELDMINRKYLESRDKNK
jgi:hypothetical protein